MAAGGQCLPGAASHFCVWNADSIAETVWVNGCVVDSVGARSAGATLISDGIDHSGTSSAITDASGAFRIPMQDNRRAKRIGLRGTLLTNTRQVTTSSSEMTPSRNRCRRPLPMACPSS
ncbi:hypothetical protein DBR42_11515 [Pelomonas sp. HMWF004]|nr:hypothetical protein DBR42_11515 [Pelomonas sp. HMWF004]